MTRFMAAALAVSICAGLFTSCWGAYKDAPYERFSHTSFWRSVLFAVLIFGVWWVIPSLRARVQQLSLFQIFFLNMGTERIAIEIYKPCFRTEDQSKYLIPQDMSFGGVHIASPILRAAIGIVLTAATIGLMLVSTRITSYAAFLVVAVVTGVVICIGGAGKDAPFEGFQWNKFFRSAIVLAVMSPVFWLLGPTPLGLLIFMLGGFERILVESYKTYFTPFKPGKFLPDSPVIDEEFVREREALRYVALVITIGVATLYANALYARFG
jgi:hypothetical protein